MHYEQPRLDSLQALQLSILLLQKLLKLLMFDLKLSELQYRSAVLSVGTSLLLQQARQLTYLWNKLQVQHASRDPPVLTARLDYWLITRRVGICGLVRILRKSNRQAIFCQPGGKPDRP